MRGLKMIVLITVPLLVFASLSFAVTAGMSLQELNRQSDAVVIGTIFEVHKISVDMKTATEHWLATCRMERYIKGPKIHNYKAEEVKAVKLISIAFIRRPLAKSILVNLWEGKRYLLFLKETGANEYEMTSPHYGAFEAGQDYFVYDEQSPEYPKAVKMSFEEIVQRVTPSQEEPLYCSISADKKVYGVGEKIAIRMEVKNTSGQELQMIDLAKVGSSLALSTQVLLFDIKDSSGRVVPYQGAKKDYWPGEDRYLLHLVPGVIMAYDIVLNAAESGSSYSLGKPDRYQITARYCGLIRKDLSWPGCIASNTIMIEVRDQEKTDLPALSDSGAFPEQYHDAARAVAVSLLEAGEDPKEFFAQVEPKDGNRFFIFHLWHRSAFEPQNVGMPGNPGGKCRDVWYDTDSHEVTKTLFWQ